jgi:hypothetical protein
MTAEELIALIANRKIAYMYALDEAQNDAPLGPNECYESDEWYQTAIEVLTDLLKEIEDKK